MKTKKVNCYYCDFCDKKGLSASHIARHERSCTMNPNRVCRMCAMMDLKQHPMKTLLALLPDPTRFNLGEFDEIGGKDLEAITQGVVQLRKATDNCPACILATLRQRDIPVPAAQNFHFKEECQSWWKEFNHARWAESEERERTNLAVE